MTDVERHRRILGVDADATVDVIKASYRSLAKKLHPDVGGSAEEFRALTEAYEFLVTFRPLVNPKTRVRYDETKPFKIYRNFSSTLELPFEGSFIDHDTDLVVSRDGKVTVIRLYKGTLLPQLLTVHINGQRTILNLKGSRGY